MGWVSLNHIPPLSVKRFDSIGSPWDRPPAPDIGACQPTGSMLSTGRIREAAGDPGLGSPLSGLPDPNQE